MGVVCDKLFYIKSIYLLGRKKYSEVEKISWLRYRNNSNNYEIIYILALCYFYKNEFEKSLQYFKCMFDIRKEVKKSIQEYFIRNIFGRWNVNKNFKDIIKHYEYLMESKLKKKPMILLLQYACNAYFFMNDYCKCLKIIEKIESIDNRIRGLKEKKEQLIKFLE